MGKSFRIAFEVRQRDTDAEMNRGYGTRVLRARELELLLKSGERSCRVSRLPANLSEQRQNCEALLLVPGGSEIAKRFFCSITSIIEPALNRSNTCKRANRPCLVVSAVERTRDPQGV